MEAKYADILKGKMDAESFVKLEALENDKLHAFVADAVELCRPDAVKVLCDDPADITWMRQRAIETGEESPLATDGHTIHFDGYHDQARDKAATRYLVPEGVKLSEKLNQLPRAEGLDEIRRIMDGIMVGKTAYVRFFCLGPTNSVFSIPCAQVTDSSYVAHSEDMLYRTGYGQFRKIGAGGGFFRLLHSAGRLEGNVSADVDKRRIYIDIAEELVYSANTQYAGNTVGLKKLSLRLALRKADREGWLAEHMFVMGVHGPGGRVTYLAGAFPSACGKTSTAMLPGETIVGDDLAYFRIIDGQARCVNVESGIFGIIQEVNAADDPVIFNVLQSPGEVIFSNVLTKDGRPYWTGMGVDIPSEGVNHSVKWHAGKQDAAGREIPPSHKNARYTVPLKSLSNLDERWDDPDGVPVSGVIYGGRDSDTSVPVQQSFDWAHGIITMGASLESETTSATLGAEGVRTFNLMSNLDFLSIPLGKYIRNNLDFVDGLDNVPLVFGTNYFLKGDGGKGEYLNGKLDKGVWVKWMELRVHSQADVVQAPTGLLPAYDDLRRLFRETLDRDYSREEYIEQFTVRIPENLAKLGRIEAIYRDVPDTPEIVFRMLTEQRKRLEQLRGEKGDYVSPLEL